MTRRPEEPNCEKFLRDVAHHQLKALRDDGVNRHLQFRNPGTYCMGFDIITWPGYLCYTGDMGTYVFMRTHDMFEFFPSRHHSEDTPLGLKINPSYWSEKVQAADRNDGITEYSEEIFRERITEWLDDIEGSPELRALVDEEILDREFEGEHEARRAVFLFQYKGRNPFQDFHEVNLHEYTYRFIWCCYAIVWGIEKYNGRARAAA